MVRYMLTDSFCLIIDFKISIYFKFKRILKCLFQLHAYAFHFALHRRIGFG